VLGRVGFLGFVSLYLAMFRRIGHVPGAWKVRIALPVLFALALTLSFTLGSPWYELSILAGRMLPGQPEQAAQQVKDVEQVSRQALVDVREAVSGYRRPRLSGELAAAEMALTADRVTADVSGLPVGPDGGLDGGPQPRGGGPHRPREGLAVRAVVLANAPYQLAAAGLPLARAQPVAPAALRPSALSPSPPLS
jgi:hypothetical protein